MSKPADCTQQLQQQSFKKSQFPSAATTTVLTEYCNQLQQQCNAENKLPAENDYLCKMFPEGMTAVDASYRKKVAAMLLPTENDCCKDE